MLSPELVLQNMFSPPILFFILGILATLLRSDLKIPDAVATALSVFILASIGLRAGVEVKGVDIVSVILPVLVATAIGPLITIMVYGILKGTTNIGKSNAASVAGHYGAVGSLSLAVAIQFVENIGAKYEAFVPALYPFMDTAALITAVILSRIGSSENSSGEISSGGMSFRNLIQETVFSKAPLLLLGCFLIGFISGETGTRNVMPLFDQMFRGVLTIFMLDVGVIAGSRISYLLKVNKRVFAYALMLPPIHGIIGVVAATLIGLSPGGVTIFATLTSGSSFISAPAVMRTAIPDANPSLPLSMILGLSFPFNAIVGIPLYYQAAHMVSAFIR